MASLPIPVPLPKNSVMPFMSVARQRGFPWVADKGFATDILIYHSWHVLRIIQDCGSFLG